MNQNKTMRRTREMAGFAILFIGLIAAIPAAFVAADLGVPSNAAWAFGVGFALVLAGIAIVVLGAEQSE